MKAIHEVQQKNGFKNLLLEKKLTALADTLEKKVRSIPPSGGNEALSWVPLSHWRGYCLYTFTTKRGERGSKLGPFISLEGLLLYTFTTKRGNEALVY